MLNTNNKFSRRAALAAGMVAGAGVVFRPRLGWSQNVVAHRYDLSLHHFSVKSLFDSGELKLDNYAHFVKTKFGIPNIEFTVELCESLIGNPNRTAQLRKISEDEGVRNRVFLCGESPLDSADASQRKAAIDQHMKWAEAADGLGCQYLRVRASGADGSAEEHLKTAASGIGALCDLLRDSSVSVLIENIAGHSRSGEWMIKLAKMIGIERVGLLADFGNFEGDLYEGMRQMIPLTRSICTKSWEFDSSGNETKIDFAKMMGVINRSKFHGCIAIEYLGDNPHVGIPKTVDLIRKYAA